LQASVSVPSNQKPLDGFYGNLRPISWTYASGLLAIAVAAMSLARQVLQAARHSRADSSTVTATPLSSTDEATVASVAPFLLAAETAAGVDETASLSEDELEKLELNLRMLITTMDAQLSELQDGLAQYLPESAIRALDQVSSDLAEAEDRLAAEPATSADAPALEARLTELQWTEFGILTADASDEDKRSYRSLLYNRGVQMQLLRQVERQVALRDQIADVERRLLGRHDADATSTTGKPSDATRGTHAFLESTARSGVGAICLGIAGISVPHPDKVATGGEDAFFIDRNHLIFGVADGVGGWAENGVDPSEYPRLLMKACHKGATRHADPLMVLKNAFSEAHAPGSCTVSLASLTVDDTLSLTSLGDCGTRIVRNGRVVFASEIQEHKFNQPYQLASPKFYVGDAPHDARQYTVVVQPGDVIVMGSDGLWDNLWDHELENEVSNLLELPPSSPPPAPQMDEGTPFSQSRAKAEALAERIAGELAEKAAAHSQDATYPSPFASERRENMMPSVLRGVLRSKPLGGKLDDITVVVAVCW